MSESLEPKSKSKSSKNVSPDSSPSLDLSTTSLPMASKFTKYKPNGLSHMGCNDGGLPQA